MPRYTEGRRNRALAVWCAAVFLGGALLVSVPAQAAFHRSQIVEIHRGTLAEPTAQYVVIQAYTDLQNLFSGVEILLFDAAGSPLPSFHTLTANLPNMATNQQHILIATVRAQQIYGVAAEIGATASGSLPADGMVCFRRGIIGAAVDCVSYGAYTGSSTVAGSQAGTPAPAIRSGASLHRSLKGDGVLQFADDTNDSATDFFLGGAQPQNFDDFTTSRLSLRLSGGQVQLVWTNPDTAVLTFSTHRSDNLLVVRGSAPVATVVMSDTWTDPQPATQPPNLLFYLVKP